ncbi:transcriptional regulator with XRE-family HTH domain [Streptacidiphilus sp. MAP12-20]|uniref:helix-turn-helix domain-containing protein n=1 Tax=Streptacidiphilus sp. MAP12-20 TaxID=3156299 RepID=UPI0035122904
MPNRPTVTVDGAAIRQLRMLAGCEMADLADRVGITRSYLSRIETGTRRQVRPRVYAALRTALEASDQQLLADHENGGEHHERHP